ncbi:MAG: hypothetical protein J7513_06490 [Solirubrobacteraceae bacterium]|nr:hypothetical protein [Solirubrobacteraceae bacterium]
MYASATLAPLALRTSAATVDVTAPGRCALRVPFTGTLTSQTQTAMTSSLRKLLVELRYGTRLRGLSVSLDDDTIVIEPVATTFALRQWLDSGELIGAVEAAARHARATSR